MLTATKNKTTERRGRACRRHEEVMPRLKVVSVTSHGQTHFRSGTCPRLGKSLDAPADRQGGPAISRGSFAPVVTEVEPGEQPEDATVPEVKEETGLEVRPESYLSCRDLGLM
jgi:ADP-ribose pyrophosphatase YjhB (NUDIX family)